MNDHDAAFINSVLAFSPFYLLEKVEFWGSRTAAAAGLNRKQRHLPIFGLVMEKFELTKK